MGKYDLQHGGNWDFRYPRFRIGTTGANFFNESKLYVSFGKKHKNNRFLFINPIGKRVKLASMLSPLEYLSLTASQLFVLAAGGHQQKFSSLYTIAINKWMPLPNLNYSYQSPGVCMIHSKRAFCFSGSIFGVGKPPLESLKFSEPGDTWKNLRFTLPGRNLQEIKMFSFRGGVYLFGKKDEKSKLFQFSEDGNFLKDLSKILPEMYARWPNFDSKIIRNDKMLFHQIQHTFNYSRIYMWNFDGIHWKSGFNT